MRKLLGMALMLLTLPNATHASIAVAQREEGERTFVCWRYESDPVRHWRIRTITVEAHTAPEAIAACTSVLRDETLRNNRRVVRT